VDVKQLIEKAKEARERAYVPYSRFPVGAALLAQDGRLFLGCNIENASYSLTQCAERTALFSAVAQGVRRFTALAVIADTPKPVTPCGACRQVLAEWCSPGMKVYLCRLGGEWIETTIGELLPLAFSQEDLDV